MIDRTHLLRRGDEVREMQNGIWTYGTVQEVEPLKDGSPARLIHWCTRSGTDLTSSAQHLEMRFTGWVEVQGR